MLIVKENGRGYYNIWLPDSDIHAHQNNLNWYYVILLKTVIHYTINDFPWGEYKDWSTHGTWYSPRPFRHKFFLKCWDQKLRTTNILLISVKKFVVLRKMNGICIYYNVITQWKIFGFSKMLMANIDLTEKSSTENRLLLSPESTSLVQPALDISSRAGS